MNKTFKKMLSLVIALAMVMVMSLTAFASETEPGDDTTNTKTYTVTITQNEKDKGTHTYGAYQIFKGTLAEDGTLSNIEWGSGITDAGKTELGDAAAYAKTITEANAAAKAAELAGYLASPEKTGSDKIEGLEGGYYLIQDTTDPDGDPSSKTKFILKVLKDETVTVKSSVPSAEKKVRDINDSDATPTLTNLQDSADYDIGDTVPYTITATIGTGIANYDHYSFNFVDSMSKGLTLDASSWDIKVGTESIKGKFTLTSKAGDDGATVWTWAATDIKDKITDGSKVVLTYNCVLNKDAVVGAAGNPNTMHVEFDNNPNSCGQGQPGGNTPDDTNIVFTYKTVFNKVDSSKNKVEGADFKLEKKVNGEWVDVTNLGSGENKPTKTLTGGNVFTFSGLDDGDYKLTETVTPATYNTIEPIEFTITADHQIESDNPALTSLTGTDGHEFTMTSDVTAGSLTADVINEKGSTLPSTRGMGTTLFYVLGAVLVLGAGVVLISRRRMEA